LTADRLRGGTAVVTGGAGQAAGLGRELIAGFARAGMRVAVLDLDGAAAEALADRLRSDGVDAVGIPVDVTDPETLVQAADRVRRELGACNVLAAHVGGEGQGHVLDIDFEAWRRALDLMVLGTVATVQAFVPLMRDTKGFRRILITSSVAALTPGRLQGPYRAAKAAVTSIGETLDLELGPEGIGTTIAFPSGMMPSDLVAFAREAIARGPGSEDPPGDNVQMSIAREMAPDPADIASPEAVASKVIAAVEQGRRYVVSHGVSAAPGAHERHVLLDRAFVDAAEPAPTGPE